MIRINLLPTEKPKHPRAPVGWIAAAVAFFALTLVTAFGVHRYTRGIVPRLETRLAGLNLERDALTAADGELQDIKSRIEVLTNGVDSAKNLYLRRVIWSKLLQDLKQVVNGEGVWLTRIAGYGRLLTIDCRTAADSKDAVARAEKVLADIREYSPPEAEGLAGMSVRELMADGWPLLKRVGPAPDGQGAEFTIEMFLK